MTIAELIANDPILRGHQRGTVNLTDKARKLVRDSEAAEASKDEAPDEAPISQRATLRVVPHAASGLRNFFNDEIPRVPASVAMRITCSPRHNHGDDDFPNSRMSHFGTLYQLATV